MRCITTGCPDYNNRRLVHICGRVGMVSLLPIRLVHFDTNFLNVVLPFPVPGQKFGFFSPTTRHMMPAMIPQMIRKVIIRSTTN